MLFGECQSLEGVGGAYLGASDAVVEACAAAEVENGMEHLADAKLADGGADDAGGAGGDANAAAGAAHLVVGARLYAGGCDGIELLLARPAGERGEGCRSGDSGQECPAVEGLDGGVGGDGGLHQGHLQAVAAASQGDGAGGAGCGAVEAHDAAAEVDGVGRGVDALALAAADAQAASGAFVGVDVDMVEGVAREGAESGADGAECVA